MPGSEISSSPSSTTFPRISFLNSAINMSLFQIGPREYPDPPYSQMCDDQSWRTYIDSQVYICGGKSPREVIRPYNRDFVRLLHDIAHYHVQGQNPVKIIAINDLSWSDFGDDRFAYHTALVSFPSVTSLFLDKVHCSCNELYTLLRSYTNLQTLNIQRLILDSNSSFLFQPNFRGPPSFIKALDLDVDSCSPSLLPLLSSHSHIPFVLDRLESLTIIGQSGPIIGRADRFAAIVSLVAMPLELSLIVGRIEISDETPYLDVSHVTDLKFTVYLDPGWSYCYSLRWWGHVIDRRSADLQKVTICIQGRNSPSLPAEDVPYWTYLDQALCGKPSFRQLCFQVSMSGQQSQQSCQDLQKALRRRLSGVIKRYGALGRISWLDDGGQPFSPVP
ncbi:uncharacterized protein BT62DRAFT_996697 [Guyanagaster necrorhizus]|uniref:Uncharacterized protein n=1 Tax=Guyanagaster necrorhizus TaxID=856835 RepID=A0A9P7VJL5_9AGAR|nr:uncharacterized protein BT62DRAFT_996697 [Guyanagaster necrorhizus MCA 3950]KAG7442336.1 hypothetical protein BT62DRAFT_996697 [Guyanagaster necrorhizus MCA 3950]